MTTEEQVARLTQIVCHLVQVLDGSHTGHPAATDEHGRLDLQQLCAELNELAEVQKKQG